MRNRGAGFTLIEVLVTVVILATGIVVVLQAFNVSLSALQASRDVLWGTMLAREKLTESRLQVLGSFGDMTGLERGRFSDRYRDYSWEQRVVAVPLVHSESEPSDGQLHEITVSVWRGDQLPGESLVTYARSADMPEEEREAR